MRKHVLLLIAALLAVVLTLWACAQNITEKPAPTGEEAVSGGETQPGENGEDNGTGQNSGVPEYLTQDPTVHYVRIRWDRDTYISSFNRDFYASDSNLMISAQMIDGLSDLKAFIDKYSEVLLLDRSVDGVPAFTETVKPSLRTISS